MPITIKRLDHVAFATDEFDRTRALCEEVLQLKPVGIPATGFDGYKLAWFHDNDGVEYHVSKKLPDLVEKTHSGFNQSLYSHVAFEVESLEDAKEHLTELGFEYHELKGEGILSRKQLYVLIEDLGLMLELFESIGDAERAL